MQTLEELLEDPQSFNLPISPLQRAIARAADGSPPTESPQTIGKWLPIWPQRRPKNMVVIAGVRSGKSILAGAAAWHSAMVADLSPLRPGETARVPIVAPLEDNATQTFDLLYAAVQNGPALKRSLFDTNEKDSLIIKRQDNRKVEIKVVAASRGAVTLRSRWLAGYVLEEVAFFGDALQGYKINAEDLYTAGDTRLLKSGQGWIISSPNGTQGFLYDMWKKYWQKQQNRVVVVQAPTVVMNPAFDQEEVEELRKRDPDKAAREYDASWTDPLQALIPADHLDKAFRPEEPRHSGLHYVAAMDPGTRGNAWTLAVGTRRNDHVEKKGPVVSIVAVREWRGSQSAPLSPRTVLTEIRDFLLEYEVTDVTTDQWSADALRDIAEPMGLHIWDITLNTANKLEMFEALRIGLADERLDVAYNAQLRSDLLLVRKRVGVHGVSIDLQKTPDGRHCDFAMCVALALYVGASIPDEPLKRVAYQSPEWHALAHERDKEEAILDAELVAMENRPTWWTDEHEKYYRDN